MAKVTDQTIPSELKDLYDAALFNEPWVFDEERVGKRLPFRIPSLQGCRTIRPPIKRGLKVTAAMCIHRHLFGDCVRCFQKQPDSGGVEPPAIGPRNRSWWFADAVAAGLWYFTHFMKETLDSYVADVTPDWCKALTTGDAEVDEAQPNTKLGGRTWLAWGRETPNRRYSYLQTTIPNPKRLKVYVYGVGLLGLPYSPPYHVKCYKCDSFVEADITWNDRPAAGVLLDSVSWDGTANQWITFDVQGNKNVVLIKSGRNINVVVRAREYADASKRPYWIM